MNFLLNALSKQVISLLPASDSILYYVQRNIIKSLPASDVRFSDRCAMASKHLRYIKPGARIYEFGAGYDLLTALFLASKGHKGQTVTDIKPLAKPELTFHTAERLGLKAAPLIDQGIRYIAPCDARHTPFSDHAFDFIHSTSVLEHVPPSDIALIAKECSRLLRPGGLLSLVIDMGDHYSIHDDISVHNFYKYSDLEWSILNPSVSYQNRLRYPDYLQIFKAADFKILHEDLARTPLPEIKLDKRFRKYDAEDLEIHTAHIVMAPGMKVSPPSRAAQ